MNKEMQARVISIIKQAVPQATYTPERQTRGVKFPLSGDSIGVVQAARAALDQHQVEGVDVMVGGKYFKALWVRDSDAQKLVR